MLIKDNKQKRREVIHDSLNDISEEACLHSGFISRLMRPHDV